MMSELQLVNLFVNTKQNMTNENPQKAKHEPLTKVLLQVGLKGSTIISNTNPGFISGERISFRHLLLSSTLLFPRNVSFRQEGDIADSRIINGHLKQPFFPDGRTIGKIYMMKSVRTLILLVAFVVFFLTSCKKQVIESAPAPGNEGVRKVQFSLFTDKDFTNDTQMITFSLTIHNVSNTLQWDSVLAPMQLKDIPKLANKLVIVKPVPNNDQSLLHIGFYYAIQNVGNSWYLDSLNAGEKFKEVAFNFQ
jgi:hypothetical protein